MAHLCYIFIGPSGSGKTSLAAQLFSTDQKVISHTSRPARAGEKEGQDYYFVTTAEFEAMIAEGAFAEYDRYNGNYYGVSKQAFNEKLHQGTCYDALTLSGFLNLEEAFEEQIIPVVLEADRQIVKERMQKRGEAKEMIEKRLQLFDQETAGHAVLQQHPRLITINANCSLKEMVAEFQNKLTHSDLSI